MKYGALVDIYDRLAATDSTNEKRDILATVFVDAGELLTLVDSVDPDRVYTQHGSAASLATHLTNAGYDATVLRQNQTSLGDF